MKQGIQKVDGNWDNHMIKIFQWRKVIVEQILEPEEINPKE